MRHGVVVFNALSLTRWKDISDLEVLKTLQHCPVLRKMDLRGNPCCQAPGYIDKVKSLLPSIQELDGEKV